MINLEISAIEDRPAEVFSISQARTTIGRHPENDIVVDSSIMSGIHAEIVRTDDGEWSIEDLGSINGTFVNGEQITCSPIEPGDKLRFGNIEGLLTDSDQPETTVFGALAISQAKQAMEHLEKGLPSGSSQPVRLESGAVEEAAAGDPAPADAAALDGDLQTLQRLPNEQGTEISAGGADPDADAKLASRVVEIELLEARISELEKHESDLVLANRTLTERLGKASGLLEAKRAESEETNADGIDLRERLVRSERALSEKAEAITELTGRLAEKEARLADQQRAITELEANLEAISQQADQGAVEKIERATMETAALRTELDELKSVHGEVAEARAQFGAIQQEQISMQREIESFQPERARLQQELEDFLAQAEAARAEANEENAEVLSTLADSRKQLEVLNEVVNEAQQQEDLRAEKVLASIRELEQRRNTEVNEVNRIEEQKAAAERQLNEVALSTQEMESKCASIGAQIAKGEKALKGIHRKIGWRKKLLARMKTVARRERDVAKKIEEGKRFIHAAESHKSQVQPWDVDRARADRERAIEEAKIIQQEADLVKAVLQDKQAELERIEAEISQKQQPNPFQSGITEDPDENDPESEDTSRLTAQLREVRQGLVAEVL